jgi:chemotaxis protein CheZ
MDKTLRLELAKRLVAEIEADEEQKVTDTLRELARETACGNEALFNEVGQLTRELHEAIKNFALDGEIAEIVKVDMPDAADRLKYVIDTTESAAHQTINSVEAMMDVSQRLRRQSDELHTQWSKFLGRDLAFEDFKKMSGELKEFLEQSGADARMLHDSMNEILMAQGVQDITGQIIKKVIKLVQDVEGRLIDLVKLAGDMHTSRDDTDLQKKKMAQEDGPAVPGVTQSDVVNGQDDVDDLLSSLGF